MLTRERLYYYESENSQGGERGSGVIDLKCFIDCVEAPLADHKKATNVFILIAKERGFFDQVVLTNCPFYLILPSFREDTIFLLKLLSI